MKTICDRLLRLAAEMVPQVRMTFKRSEKADASVCNAIAFELQRFVDTVRSNEGLRTDFERIDDDEAMVLVVSLSEHEARKAIVEELERKARKLAKKNNLKLEM